MKMTVPILKAMPLKPAVGYLKSTRLLYFLRLGQLVASMHTLAIAKLIRIMMKYSNSKKSPTLLSKSTLLIVTSHPAFISRGSVTNF